MGGRKKNTKKGVPEFGDDDACAKGWHGRCLHAIVCQSYAASAGEKTEAPTYVWKCGCRGETCAETQRRVQFQWETQERSRSR